MIVQSDTDLLEKKLDIESGSCLINFMVDYYLGHNQAGFAVGGEACLPFLLQIQD